MSHDQGSHMMKRKTMADYFTSEEKLKKIKLQDTKDIKDDKETFSYKEKKVHHPEEN